MIDQLSLPSTSAGPLLRSGDLKEDRRRSTSELGSDPESFPSPLGAEGDQQLHTASMVVTSPNLLEADLNELLSHGADEPFAILKIGLDRFKALNDLFGRNIGDEVLQRCSERLQSTLREHDRLLQLPGDEFIVLLRSQASLPRARLAVTRLQDLVQRPYLVQGQLVSVKASIGLVASPHQGTNAEGLFRRAGLALEHARSSSPGTLCLFESSMEEQLLKRHALLLDLRKALPLRQFAVHYQPQVDIRSRRLHGFEALLRWHHPKLGPISPGEFIPLAEEYNMIAGIGDWVLRTACQQAKELPAGVVMAVNASPLQFEAGDFPTSVKKVLASTGLPAEQLEIEVTEGVFVKAGEKVSSALDELSTIGIRLAMDDFGTGYSCLGQLANLPFNLIKIDRSLIGGTPKQRAIVRAISTLGQGMGMSVLAEGVETEEQLSKASDDGCRLAQGYLFGKALPASDMSGVIARLQEEGHKCMLAARGPQLT